MSSQSFENLPPARKTFNGLGRWARGAPGRLQTVGRHVLADITNTNMTAAVIKTETQTRRRHSDRLTARLDYAEPTVAEIDQMTDEEIIREMHRHTREGGSNGTNASAPGGVGDSAHHEVIDLTEATATPDDVHPRRQGVAIQDGMGTSLVILKVDLEKLRRQQQQQQQQQKEQETPGDQLDLPHPVSSSVDHPVLRLEALLHKLDKNKASQAQQVLDLIRENLKEGQDAKGLIEHVVRLFGSVKQLLVEELDRLPNDLAVAEQEMERIAENRDRLSGHMAQIEQEMQILDDVDLAADKMDIDG